MEFIKYKECYKQEIIDLILHIQNDEAKIGLSLEEQPDLLDIENCYMKRNGNFLLAVENQEVIGTFAYMDYGNSTAVLKKFFVRADWRGKRIGFVLYEKLMEEIKEKGFSYVILDTPSVAHKAHRFYEKSGFTRITKEELPCHYEYPDRDCYLYMLKL